MDPILKDLVACVEDGELNTNKFLSSHPLTASLEKSLVSLKKRGYLMLDYGDDRLLLFDATPKLLNLAKK